MQHLPLIIASSHVGIDTGPDGPTHQAIEDIGIFSTYPGVQVCSPCDANQVQALLEAAILSGKPTYMRTGRSPLPVINPPKMKYEIGRDAVLHEGKDVSIFATGIMVHRAIEARKLLQQRGIDAEIINIASINPLDKETILGSVRKTGRAITAEDHYIKNGLGSAIGQLVAAEYPVKVRNVALFGYAESGSPQDLADKYGLSIRSIVEECISVITDN